MLTISDLTYRIAGRTLFAGANAVIADGWRVGLVGRNGTGKSTLLRLIIEEAPRGSDSIKMTQGARLGHVAQEIPAVDTPLLEIVLAADTERAALMAEADTATDPDRIAAIHARLYDIDAHSAEARAAEVLAGLGFSQADLARPARAFSGGWRMRAALAGVLFSTPDLLLLDEPTNYLDLEGAAWLEGYLRRYPNTVILVSHDREMLNRCVTHTLALADQTLELCPGGYDAYLKRRAERSAHLTAQKAKQDAERARLQGFIDRFRAKASKATQAQSRIKMLERMGSVTVPLEDRTDPFRFPDPAPLASPILELEGAELGYGPEARILADVAFRLDQDDRIVIVGPNGQGKTTLVKSIAARLPLLAGQRRAARALKIGYFSQDQLDELHAGETPLDHIRQAKPGLSGAAQRSVAAQLGFGPQKIDTPVEKLSGGEKVRLLLGLMALDAPHVMILDEPTSHLDIDSREALIHALNSYQGAVLLITHDVYLAEAVADRLWLVFGGRAQPYDGDLSAYRSLVLDADRPKERPQPGGQAKAAAAQTAKPAPTKPASGPGRTSPSTLKRKLDQVETDLAKAQAQLAKIDAQLANPAVYSQNPAEAQRLVKARETAAAVVNDIENAWLELTTALEEAQA